MGWVVASVTFACIALDGYLHFKRHLAMENAVDPLGVDVALWGVNLLLFGCAMAGYDSFGLAWGSAFAAAILLGRSMSRFFGRMNYARRVLEIGRTLPLDAQSQSVRLLYELSAVLAHISELEACLNNVRQIGKYRTSRADDTAALLAGMADECTRHGLLLVKATENGKVHAEVDEIYHYILDWNMKKKRDYSLFSRRNFASCI
jgi:hypothetical protein